MVEFTPVQFDFALVANAMNAKANERLVGLTRQSTTQASAPSSSANAELAAGAPPWRQEEADLAKRVLAALKSGNLISSSVSRKALSSEEDTPKIFAAYNALAQLKSLADGIVSEDVSSNYFKRAQSRLNEGLAEVSAFLDQTNLKAVTLLKGEKLSRADSQALIERASYNYTTRILHSGDPEEAIADWAGLSGFDIKLDKTNTSQTISIDLSSLADADRTLSNVVDLINTELEAAGALSRFERTKIGPLDDNGIPQGEDWGLLIKGAQTETLSFSTASSKPALYMLGASGERDTSSGQLSKWTDLDAAAPTRALTNRFVADPTLEGEKELHNDSQFLASAAGPDGSIYALAETKGAVNGQTLRTDEDLVLIKYDSAGKEIWSRVVGSSDEISGSSIAVADDGRIAIGGSTLGKLSDNAAGGARDGFVIMYNVDGVETLARQRGASFDDEVTSLAFDSTGALFVGGYTKSAMTDNAHGGGSDAFVEKLDTNGDRVWINQWGADTDERITSITTDDAGNAIIGAIENGDAVLRRVSGDTFTADDWTHTLGSGAVRGLHWNNGELYAAGETRLDGRTSGEFSGNNLTAADAFALRLDVSGTNVTEAWFNRFGGDGDQTSPTILEKDGQVYLAGSGETAFGSAVVDGDASSFVTSLDATTGAENWSEALSGRGGVSTAAGLVISDNGDSILDKFGLPSGVMSRGDTNNVTDRTSARPGDHFYISVEGGRRKKIEIESGDTYRALSLKINSVLVLDGKAESRRGTGGQSLRITPTENTRIELSAGAAGQDLLQALGLPEGVVYKTPIGSDDSASTSAPVVSLEMSKTVSLEEKEDAEAISVMLDTALRGLRKAYRYAIEDPTLTSLLNASSSSSSNQSSGPSAYQQAQLANLQAGLIRLQAGSPSSGFFA